MTTHELALTISGYGQINPKGIPSGDISNTVIANGIVAVMVIAVVLTLIYIIWAGINIVTSEGDKVKMQQARNKITFAIIGIVLILSSYFIINIVTGFFGIHPFGQSAPSVSSSSSTCPSGTHPTTDDSTGGVVCIRDSSSSCPAGTHPTTDDNTGGVVCVSNSSCPAGQHFSTANGGCVGN